MKKQNNKSDFLLTRHTMLNISALTALIDMKEDMLENNPTVYMFMKNSIETLILEQQKIHDAYKLIIPNKDLSFWEKADEINDAVDKILLKK